jgi:hypothetical protein
VNSSIMTNVTNSIVNGTLTQMDLLDKLSRKNISEPMNAILVILYTTLIIIGSSGNFLVIFAVLRNKQMRTPRLETFNYYILLCYLIYEFLTNESLCCCFDFPCNFYLHYRNIFIVNLAISGSLNFKEYLMTMNFLLFFSLIIDIFEFL